MSSSDTESSQDKFKITVELAGKRFKLNISREEEEEYRKAARMVNESYDGLVKRIPTANDKAFDINSYLSLSALEMALKYQKLKKEVDAMQDGLQDLENDLSPIFDK